MKAVLYKDRKHQWRWRIVAANGRKVANCGEGYINRSHALKMLTKFATALNIKDIPT